MKYPVMEQFQTLQGEGVYAGHSAYFIRLGGCDVGCVWCDVKDSWNASAHPQLELSDILSLVEKSPSLIIVITGGEPTMHDLGPLCEGIHKLGKRTHIETAATNPITGSFDWICISPKKFKDVLPSELPLAHELKVIIFNKSDFEWAQQFETQVNKDCALTIQPEWSKQDKLMPQIIDFVENHPNWRLSLQTHKYLGIE
jgi:organic radical activating enzyme